MPDETYLSILDDAIAAIEGLDIPYGFIGGVASATLGRPRWPRGREDIDFFCRAEDAGLALKALEDAGFETERHNEQWIYKAKKDDIVVDLIFRSSGDIYMDDEMIERTRDEEFHGRKVRVISPEDMIVMKAIAHGEETFSYWHDALGIIAAQHDLDWSYVVERARRHGVRRILSLLLYAQSNDLVVPSHVIGELYNIVQPS